MLLIIAFCFYGLALFSILFIRVGSTDRQTYFDKQEIHLIPFESTFNSIRFAATNDYPQIHKNHQWYLTVRNIVGNLLLFFPFGFLLPLISKRFTKYSDLLYATLGITLFAETLQYCFVVGVFDIDDIIYNCIGSLYGLWLFHRLKSP